MVGVFPKSRLLVAALARNDKMVGAVAPTPSASLRAGTLAKNAKFFRLIFCLIRSIYLWSLPSPNGAPTVPLMFGRTTWF